VPTRPGPAIVRQRTALAGPAFPPLPPPAPAHRAEPEPPLFRLHGPDDPHPGPRLVWVCIWAAALGTGGLVIAVRVLFGLFTTIPTGYLLAISTLGLFGLTATTAALAGIHHRTLPWPLLTIATGALLIALPLTTRL